MTVDEEQATGEEIAKELGLKLKKNGRYNMAHGDKTPIGLCRTIKRIYDMNGKW